MTGQTKYMLVVWAVAFFIVLFCMPAKAADSNTPLHIGYSAGITTALYFSLSAFTGREQECKGPSLLGAAVFTLGLGLAKEIIDGMIRGDRHLDSGDLQADLIGVAAATAVIYFLDIHGAKPAPGGIAFQF